MNNTCTHMDVHLHIHIPMSIGKTYANLSSFACIGEMNKKLHAALIKPCIDFPQTKDIVRPWICNTDKHMHTHVIREKYFITDHIWLCTTLNFTPFLMQKRLHFTTSRQGAKCAINVCCLRETSTNISCKLITPDIPWEMLSWDYMPDRQL